MLSIYKVDSQIDTLHFYYLTTDHGLPANKVNCMTKDAYGILWFGTLNGLVRYSGTKFKVFQYHPLDQSSLPKGEIKQLVSAPDYKIWGLTSEGILFLYDYMKTGDIEFTRLNNDDSLVNNSKIILFHEINEGQFLIFDENGKIRLFDKSSLSFIDLKLPGLRSKVNCGLTHAGDHYFGSNGVIYKISKTLDAIEEIKCPDDKFRVDFIDFFSQDKLLVGSKNKSLDAPKGLLTFDSKNNHFDFLDIVFGTGHSCNLNYDIVKFLGDSTFYIKPIGTTSYFGNIHTNEFIKLRSHENAIGMLNTGSINDVEKSGDQIFVLTNQGINVSDPKRNAFPHYFVYDEKKLMASQIGSYLDTKSNLLYVASRNFLRIVDYATKKTIYKIPYPCIHSKHSQQQVEIISLNDDEILILSSYFYIFSLKDKKFKALEKEEEYEKNLFYDIIAKYFDNNRTIFSRNGALYTFDKHTKNLKKLNIVKECNTIYPKITGIAIDDANYLWLTTENMGLMKVTLDTHCSVLYQWNPKAFILSDVIFDKYKNMWITSKTHGLLKWNFDKKTPDLYSILIGLPIYNMDQISEDRIGQFWIQTNIGITKIDPKTNIYLNFDKRHGLRYPHNIFRGKTWHSNGTLYVSGGIGIIEINPIKFLDNGKAPEVWISNFETQGIKNLKFWKDTLIVLESYQNDFQIEFDVVNFDNFKTSMIEYSFGNKTNSWVTIDPSKSTLNYNDLPPGEHVLTFRTIHDRINSVKTIRFNIKKPWYQTFYFKAILGIMLFLGIREYVKLRTKRLLEKQKVSIEKELAIDAERKRIARDMHDDLGSGLSAIHLYSDYLRSNLAEKFPDISDDINKIVLSSSELNQKVKEIIWSNESKIQSVSTIFQFLKKSYSELINSNLCNLQIEEITEEKDLSLDASTSKNIYLCLKEALNNSIKYAKAKKLYVRFNMENGQKCFTIQDDGIGFDVLDENIMKSGKGMTNIVNRMIDINGRADIQSSKDGTVIKLLLDN